MVNVQRFDLSSRLKIPSEGSKDAIFKLISYQILSINLPFSILDDNIARVCSLLALLVGG